MRPRGLVLTSNVLVSTVAVLAAAVHVAVPGFAVDATAVVLILVAVAPWMAVALKSAELPGGWKFEFQTVRAEQERQGQEIRALRLLMTCFLTKDEYRHLRRLASDEPFTFKRDGTSHLFEAELRRLRALGLVESLGSTRIGPMFADDGTAKDVREFLQVTERGKLFLALREQVGVDG